MDAIPQSLGFTMATMTPEQTIQKDALEDLFNMPAYDLGWNILVLDCDCHSQDFVVAVFMKHFELSFEEAWTKMEEVHFEGRSVLDHGTRDDMLAHKEAMNAYGLRAMIEEVA